MRSSLQTQLPSRSAIIWIAKFLSQRESRLRREIRKNSDVYKGYRVRDGRTCESITGRKSQWNRANEYEEMMNY